MVAPKAVISFRAKWGCVFPTVAALAGSTYLVGCDSGRICANCHTPSTVAGCSEATRSDREHNRETTHLSGREIAFSCSFLAGSKLSIRV